MNPACFFDGLHAVRSVLAVKLQPYGVLSCFGELGLLVKVGGAETLAEKQVEAHALDVGRREVGKRLGRRPPDWTAGGLLYYLAICFLPF